MTTSILVARLDPKSDRKVADAYCRGGHLKGEGTMEERGEGWLIFAGIALLIVGVMRIFDAIWAFRYHGVLPSNLEAAIFGHSLKTYGWVYLVVGIVMILAGFGVMVRSQFSRWIGIFAAAILGISAIWWMPYYPIWSLTYIGICFFVIYGLAAHGSRELTA
jgi:hypothetical protein